MDHDEVAARWVAEWCNLPPAADHAALDLAELLRADVACWSDDTAEGPMPSFDDGPHQEFRALWSALESGTHEAFLEEHPELKAAARMAFSADSIAGLADSRTNKKTARERFRHQRLIDAADSKR